MNSPSSVAAAIWIGIAGAALFLIQPGIVAGLVEYRGFTESEAGYIVSVDMAGIALSTLFLSLWGHRINWHYVLYGALIIIALGNVISVYATHFAGLMGVRFLTGIGEGVAITLSFAAIGLTKEKDRNYAYYIMCDLIYGAIGLVSLPLIFHFGGIELVFAMFSLLAAAALFLVRQLPTRSSTTDTGEPMVAEAPAFPLQRTLALSAMLAYFLAQGVVWTYLFLIGLEGGLDEQTVANALMIAQFGGIAGAAFTAVLGTRVARSVTLGIGITASIASLSVLHSQFSFVHFAAATALFAAAWNFVHPYLLATMVDIDRTGKTLIWAVFMQTAGIAIAPGIAAFLMHDDFLLVNWMGGGLFVASLILILPVTLFAATAVEAVKPAEYVP